MKSELPLRKSIFTKMILMFLIFIIPVYGIGYCIYTWGKVTITNRIDESESNKVNFYMESLQSELDRIQTLQYDFFNDTDLNVLSDASSVLDNYTRDQKILGIEKRLLSIKNSSKYISGLNVYILRIQKKISSRSIEDMSIEDMEYIRNISPNRKNNLLLQNGCAFLNAYDLVTINTGNTRLPKFVFEIQMSNDAIKKAFEMSADTSNGGFILYRRNSDYVLSGGPETADVSGMLAYLNNHANSNVQKKLNITINKTKYLIYPSYSNYLDLTLLTYVSENKLFQNFYLYIILFWLFSGVILLIIVVFSIYTKKLIHAPLLKLLGAFKKVESGNLDLEIVHGKPDEFMYIFDGFNHMTRSLSELINKVYKQEILVQKSELKQLQSQINPHFLFNCFFILSRRIKYGDSDTAITLAEHLGDYFRFITRSATDQVELRNEVSHARIYTNIQASRFVNRISVEFEELPEEYEKIMVPRLILQPVIENSFEYGLESKEENGKLSVSFKRHERILLISVEDNGDSISDESIKMLQKQIEKVDDNIETTAFINIHRRIRLMFGENSGLVLSSSELGGLKAELRFELEGEL